MDEQDNQNEADQANAEDTTTSKEQVDVTVKAGTVQDGDDANSDEEDDDDEDPTEALIVARANQAVRDALAKKAEEDRAAQEAANAVAYKAHQEEETKKKLNESFVKSSKKTLEALQKLSLRDEDGQPIKLTDDMVQTFIEPWNEHNGFVTQTKDGDAEARVYTNLAQAALSVVPTDKHEEFSKRANGKPLSEYLKAIVELDAPNSEFVKKLVEDSDVKVKAAYARGFSKGQKAPPGTPANPTQTAVARGKTDITTVSGAALALSKGEIDDAKFLEILNKRRDSN